MNILALDLGTKCGWAYRSTLMGNQWTDSGTWKLSDPKSVKLARAEGWDRRCDGRFNTLCFNIQQVIERQSIQAVVFEDVLFSETTLQTQLWATFRAAIWAVRRWHPVAEVRGLPDYGMFHIDCLNTSSLKKFATGHGKATKLMMSAHLVRKYPGKYRKVAKPTETCFIERLDGTKVDDNEVDALHLLDYFSHL